jgi:lysophospholipase L1-like esterase
MEENNIEDEYIRQELLIRDSTLNAIADSIQFYQSKIFHNTKLYLPDNNIHFFDSIFNEMDNCKITERIIRILHYGDSQIETDRISSNIRSFFQNKFGGGGPGMIPLIQSIPTSSVTQRISGDNISEYAIYGNAEKRDDKNYGIMAKNYRINGTVNLSIFPSSFKNIDIKVTRISRVSVIYDSFDNNFSGVLSDRKTKYKSVQTCENPSLGIMYWVIDSTSSHLNLELNGNADIFGITLDNGYGVSVDNIPIRGSSGTFFTGLNSYNLKQMYNLCDVGMIILQFGGNSIPSLSGKTSIDYYTNLIAHQIAYLKKINPDLKIIFIGPSDMSTKKDGEMVTYSLLPDFVNSIKEAVTKNGATFWDMYNAMGGENSMPVWVQNGYAVNDYVHFTPQGANIIGNSFVNNLNIFYDFFKYKKSVSEDLYLEALNLLLNEEDSVSHYQQINDTIIYE